MFYSSFALAGRTLTTVSTSITTSTELVTITSTTTATVPPPLAIVSVTSLYFPAVGSQGMVVLFNSGSVNTTVVSASLTYSGQTCYLGVTGSGIPVNPGTSTLSWGYVNGDACPDASNVGGVQFHGTVTFSNGAQVAFAGVFQ